LENTIIAAIKLVLEREPSGPMCEAGDDNNHYRYRPAGEHVATIYRAMTAQLLKELDAP
jgi:hypothetical protein